MATKILMMSGGADSTALALYLAEHHRKPDLAMHFTSDWEWPFARRIVEHVCTTLQIPLEIHTPPHSFTYYATKHPREYVNPRSGRKRTIHGYGWPNWRIRWCAAIKRDTLRTFMARHPDPVKLIGHTADERDRVAAAKADPQRQNYEAPLAADNVTHDQALAICQANGIDYTRHYTAHYHLSCIFCPLQPVKSLQNLHDLHPDHWRTLEEIDHHVPQCFPPFKMDKTVREWAARFRQQTLFPFVYDQEHMPLVPDPEI